MSRIGKTPITLPEGVDCKIDGRDITVKGPKGELKWTLPIGIKVERNNNELVVTREEDTKRTRAFHGLSRSLINNMVIGVSKGFEKKLVIVGTGYRAKKEGDRVLSFTLGYSHPIVYKLPDGIEADVDKKQTSIVIRGIDKQLVGQVAANLVSLRPPDAYKGKGIRYEGMRLKLKEGKKA